MADPFSFAIATVAQIGISYLFPSQGPRIKDMKISASTYGAAIPRVYGLTRVPGNMIWAKAIREEKKKQRGKGGSYMEYTYYCTFAMGLCAGPIKNVLRVWADGKLIYDVTGGATDPDVIAGSVDSEFGVAANAEYRLRLYKGTEEQLPDAAMEADIGAGECPAFRGLAYLLFDDMPLKDFGNRIPQITAEVYVGATEITVTRSGFTGSGGGGGGGDPLDPNFALDEVVFDWDRNSVYLHYDDSIAKLNLSTRSVSSEFDEFDLPGGADVDRLLCTSQGGSLFVTYDPNGRTPIARLDPVSMQSVAEFGVSEAGTSNTATSFVVADAVTGRNNAGGEFLFVVGGAGQAGLLKASDLAYQWGAGVQVNNTAASGAPSICSRSPDTSGNATFFAFNNYSGSLILTQFAGAVQSNVLTLTGTAVGGILWDASAPGVLMFWSNGADHYLSKFSTDTNVEAWRTEVAGYPPHLDNSAKLTTSTYSWSHAGRVYIIDTVTGQFKAQTTAGEAGAIDWAAYLEDNPDVASQYAIDGYTVASTPEGYAQWHYTNYGQDEGRPVTYITAEDGYPLESGASGDVLGFNPRTQALVDMGDGTDGSSTGVQAGSVTITEVAADVSVGTVVQELFLEGGLPPERFDLQVIYDLPLRGYGWATGTDIKSIVDELRRLFLFDMVEREGILRAVLRGADDNGPAYDVEEIPQAFLGSSSEGAMDFWQETRLQEADLPASVSLNYMNVSQNYETGTARSPRISNPLPTMFSRQQVAMEINVAMTPVEAKTQVTRILWSQWAERTRHDTRLPWYYLNLDPSDLIKVMMDDGRAYYERLHFTDIGADFAITAETYGQDSGAYEEWEGIIVADGGSTPSDVITDEPQTFTPFIMNLPLLRDADDSGGGTSRYYLAVGDTSQASSQGPAVAAIYKSSNTIDYTPIQTAAGDAEWGAVLGVVPDAPVSPFALDWQTVIRVRPAVAWFELEPCTEIEMMNGANLCVVGDEVMQFMDCEEGEDGTWTIWNLLRGRRGTEYACARHVAGERFIFLDNTSVALQGEQITSGGQQRQFRVVPPGGSVSDAENIDVTYVPRDLMPYAVADIRREFVTGGDIEIDFERRTRLGGNLMDGTGEVALSESFERYEAYILDTAFAGDPSTNAAPETYVRMLTLNDDSQFTYTAAQQAADSFDPQADTLHLVIYQLSDAVGRGFPGYRSITPDREA